MGSADAVAIRLDWSSRAPHIRRVKLIVLISTLGEALGDATQLLQFVPT